MNPARFFSSLAFSLILSFAGCQSTPAQPSVPAPTPSASTVSCLRSGCSGQLCLDAKTADQVATTCEYNAEYACYQNAVCELQPDGKCGWTPTQVLQTCLEQTTAR